MTITEDVKTKIKPRRGLGQVLTRQRRHAQEKVQEHQEARINKAREAAREELRRLKARKKTVATIENDHPRWAAALLKQVVSNQTALLRTWGYNQAVHAGIHQGENVSAWTDFSQISIQWPLSKIPKRLDSAGVLRTTAMMKGVMQHEMGHIRFTTSYKTIKDNSNIGRSKHPVGMLHRTWNMLEDQRMESLVVETVPRIGNYFGVMVAEVVLGAGATNMNQSWLMLAGRAYLPNSVLRKSYILFDEFCTQQGIQDGALTWFNLVQDYRAASTHQELADAVVAAYEFIQKVRATLPEVTTMDEHDQMEDEDNNATPEKGARPPSNILDMFDEKPKPKSKKKSNEPPEPGGDAGEPQEGEDGDGDEEGEDGKGKPGDEEGEEGDTGSGDEEGEGGGDPDEDGEGSGDDGNNSLPSSPGQSDDGEHTPNSGNTEEDLRNELTDMVDEFEDVARGENDIKEMARGARERTENHSGTGIPDHPPTSQMMSPELQSRAFTTSKGIEDALNTFLTDSAPTWHMHQEKGVIDPLHYRTKAVGARDYRRWLEDHGNSGLNVHLSVLSDVSGSMGGWSGYGTAQRGDAPIVALSEFVYATALACKEVGIGFTQTLWSTNAFRINNHEVEPVLWTANGGTDPTVALDDLDTHNPEGAQEHLVFIFTDGAWSMSFPSLRQWDAPNRTIVMVRYGSYEGAIQKDMGAHRHIHINDMSQLANALTQALVDVLSSKEDERN